MIVLSEYSKQLHPITMSVKDLQTHTLAAERQKFKVYTIPKDFQECETADNALAHIPCQSVETTAIWLGYIPSPERYDAIYRAAVSKNIRLLNSPEQYRNAMEFDLFYPKLKGLTPESWVITSVEDVKFIPKYPVFIKGAIQSRKAHGWKACVAENVEEASAIVSQLLELKNKSRGKIVIRELVSLMHVRKSPLDFPLGREYRVFVCNGRIVGSGYYWDGEDSLSPITPEELMLIHAKAQYAALRVKTPYMSVDIGQLESGEWTILEVGDGQFSGATNVNLDTLYFNLYTAARRSYHAL